MIFLALKCSILTCRHHCYFYFPVKMTYRPVLTQVKKETKRRRRKRKTKPLLKQQVIKYGFLLLHLFPFLRSPPSITSVHTHHSLHIIHVHTCQRDARSRLFLVRGTQISPAINSALTLLGSGHLCQI